uniref:DUF4220 domain-containing protein n=1 Tax=Fagus sylvatica TaxID=28930 RepID=A0A2N9IJF4_FAGSY
MVVPNLVVNNASNVGNCIEIESAQKKLEYIEGYVTVTTILIAFLVGFGSCRRRSHNGLLKTSIFIAYVLPMPLVAYTYRPDAVSKFSISERREALSMASRSYGLVRNNKLIADFMAYEHELSNEDEVDPVSMKGFKYLVKGEEKEQVKVVPPHNQNQLQLTGKAITIEMIWQCKGRLLSSTGDPDGRLKDICLSYALYRLLCRRFVGYPFSESSNVKTWKFVRNGLLSNEDDHERAFRIIEVELAFVYDLFYTKYAAIFSNKGFFQLRSIQFIIVIVGCVTMVPILTNYHTPKNDLNRLTVGGHNVDVLVTCIGVVAILFMDLVQYFVLSFSDWDKVQWLC